MKRRCPGSRPLRPSAATSVGEAIEQAKTTTLSNDKPGGQKSGDDEADSDRGRGLRPRFEMQQPEQRDRRVGDLSKKLETYVNERARRGGVGRNPGDGNRARTSDIAADLGERQHFRGRIADQASPDRGPRIGPRQQRPPGNPHHRNQREVDQAEYGKPRPPDR